MNLLILAICPIIYFYVITVITRNFPEKRILIAQTVFLLVFLVITHIYAFYKYDTYPDITIDGQRYDLFGREIARNARIGEFYFPSVGEINKPYFRDYRRSEEGISESGGVPPAYLIMLGSIYTIFGYYPVIAKLFNILFFQIATIFFYKTMRVRFPDSEENYKKLLILFSFFPIYFRFSVSLLKESFLLMLVVFFLYCMYQKKIKWLGVVSVLILFTRPYVIAVMLAGYCLVNVRRMNFKLLGLAVITIITLTASSLILHIEDFDIIYLLLEKRFMVFPQRGEYGLWVEGALGVIWVLVCHPFVFFKTILIGLYSIFLTPTPWYIPEILSDYLAISGIVVNFDSMVTFFSAFIIYYILFLFFGHFSKITDFFSKVSFEISTLILYAIFIGIFQGTSRYLYSVNVPLLLICLLYSLHNNKNQSQNLLYRHSIYFSFIMIVMVIDVFLYGRSALLH